MDVGNTDTVGECVSQSNPLLDASGKIELTLQRILNCNNFYNNLF